MFEDLSRLLFRDTPYLQYLCSKYINKYVDCDFSMTEFKNTYYTTNDNLERIAISLVAIKVYPDKPFGYNLLFDASKVFSFSFFPCKYYIIEYYLKNYSCSSMLAVKLVYHLLQEGAYVEIMEILQDKQIRTAIKKDSSLNIDPIKQFCVKVHDTETFNFFFPNDKFPNQEIIDFIDSLFEILGNDFNMHNSIIKNSFKIRSKSFNEILMWRSFWLGNRSRDFFKLVDIFFADIQFAEIEIKRKFFLEYSFLLFNVTEHLREVFVSFGTYARYDKINYLLLLYKQRNNDDNFLETERVMQALGVYSKTTRDIFPYFYERHLQKLAAPVLDNRIAQLCTLTQLKNKFLKSESQSDNIKIALEISGQIRDMPCTITQNIQYLTDCGLNIDTFLLTWDSASLKPTRKELLRFFGSDLFLLLPESVRPRHISNLLFPATLNILYDYQKTLLLSEKDFDLEKYRKISIVDEKRFENRLKSIFGKTNNSAKMYYAMNEVHKLATSNDNYDVVIRCRPDLIIEMPNLKELIQTCVQQKTTVFVCYHINGVCDQFFICSKYAMDMIGNLWEKIEQSKSFRYDNRLPKRVETVQGEFLLGQHIALSGLTVRVVTPLKRRLANYLVVNDPDLDLTEPLLADLANQPNQEGKLFVEKYIEGKKNGIVFK